MKNLPTLTFIISVCAAITLSETNLKTLSKEELSKLLATHKNSSEVYVTTNTGFSKDALATIPSDNGGNYGDLLHSNRQNGDVLLIRETIINEFTSSGELDMYWYGNFRARLSHVRVLNFGRERGYALQVATRDNDGYVEVYVRIPPHKIMRMFVEVYGFPKNSK